MKKLFYKAKYKKKFDLLKAFLGKPARLKKVFAKEKLLSISKRKCSIENK